MQIPQMLAYPQRSSPRKKNSKWHGALPVSAIEKVLSTDNKFADTLLTEQLGRIRRDRHRAQRLLAWQEQSFVLRQAIKETELRELGIPHTSFLPEIVMKMTESDVRARRPFGRVQRSSTQLDIKEENAKTFPSSEDRQTRSRRALTTAKTDPFLEYIHTKNVYTRLHGIDLPLYGPDADAKREAREQEFIHYLQRKQSKAKVTLDPRFRNLEQTLIRDGTGILLPSLDGRSRDGDRSLVGANSTTPTRSAKMLRKVQTELSQKPESVLVKSVWIDF
ncbi:uncharacterized protein LOC117293541 [Asterias rubens]|uniref:uncharacterized protein LOC117293541 n=1 Tax=Asterias rubens TaxID=7604 RepID=UPI0014553C13|nr:uncharacterized protein LOC117293541 [Asterias rubens]